MTTDKLNEHLTLIQRLEVAQERLDVLWAAAVPGAQELTGMPHQSGISDRTGAYAIEIADLESEIEEIKREIADSEANILPWISTIENVTTRLIFRFRYIRGLSWEQVASVIGGGSTEDSVRMRCYSYFKKTPQTGQ